MLKPSSDRDDVSTVRTTQLLPEELAALARLGEHAGNAAADNLGRLLGARVELATSNVRLSRIIDASKLVGAMPPRTRVACMRLDGDLRGDLLVLIPGSIEHAILEFLGVSRRDRSMRTSAVAEVANIMVGGWLVALEASTGLVARPSLPMLGDDDPVALLAPSLARAASDDDAVPAIDALLSIADDRLPRGSIHVLLLPAPGSLARIVRSLPELRTRRVAGGRVSVHMGELAVGTRRGEVLEARGLGSCVALALVDDRARIASLAHVMLPQAPPTMLLAGRPTWPARYADRAVDASLDAIEAAGGSRSSVRAYLAGGSQMFEGVLDAEQLQMGRRNVDGVVRALDARRVPVGGSDVGGSAGRTLEIDVGALSVRVAVPTSGSVRELRAA